MKLIEHQLIVAMADTPFETDCSVSAEVLQQIGMPNLDTQARWLSFHRPPRENKRWHLSGGRWEFTATPSLAVSPETTFSLPAPSHWRTAPTLSERRIAPIVVKPVTPLIGQLRARLPGRGA